MINEITKEEIQELYKILEQKILENKEKFEEKKFKDDEIINILLETILYNERQMKTNLLKYIDLKTIDFKDKNVAFIDFTKTNANIDPQTIQNKDLQGAKLYGDFKGKIFNDVLMRGTDCSNATNISINPQTLKNRDLTNANVDGVDFNNESFDEVKCEGTDFSKALNCVLTEKPFYKFKKRILEIK